MARCSNCTKLFFVNERKTGETKRYVCGAQPYLYNDTHFDYLEISKAEYSRERFCPSYVGIISAKPKIAENNIVINEFGYKVKWINSV